jgi:hypothetical protein
MLAFGIDDTTNVTLVNRLKINEGECFLFMLNRISSLQTLQELEVFWGRTNDQLSRMFNYMIARIYLGQEGRQVEVAKNAEISGSYSGSAQDYRSGGLRNMFTVTKNEYVSTIFGSAPTGSVLLVYDPSS